jgi:uncharacterized protein (UPF0276 family)
MIPDCIGVGVNFRREIEKDILRHLDRFDLVEVITDALFIHGGPTGILREVMETKPFVLHGLRASLGAAEPLEPAYRDATLEAVEQWRPAWFSDHLAFSCIGDLDVDQLMPVRRTLSNARRVSRKIRELRERTGVPFLVENITYYFDHDGDEMDESHFVGSILTEADCGLLLDVNNLFINSRNHGFDARRFVTALDPDRIVEIHMAGGFTREGMLIDSHGHRINEETWALLEFICARARPRAIIVERDANFDIGDMLESVERARAILQRSHRSETVAV